MCRYQELNTLNSMREWHAQRRSGALQDRAERMAGGVAASVPLPSDAASGGADFTASAEAEGSEAPLTADR